MEWLIDFILFILSRIFGAKKRPLEFKKGRGVLEEKLNALLETDETILKQCPFQKGLMRGYCLFTDRRLFLATQADFWGRNYNFIQISYDAINSVEKGELEGSAEFYRSPMIILDIKDFGKLSLLDLKDEDREAITDYKDQFLSTFEPLKWKYRGKGVRKTCPKCLKPFDAKLGKCPYCQISRM